MMAEPSGSTAASATSAADSVLLTDLNLAEDADLDEESSPADPSTEDQPILYVQILDRQLVPRPSVQVVVSGTGLPESRTVVTDEHGCILIEDCGPGVYELSVRGETVRAPTLTQHDLELDDSAYRVVCTLSAAT
jgi:hypothetical protein